MATGDFWSRLTKLFSPTRQQQPRQPQRTQPRQTQPLPSQQIQQPQPVAPQHGPQSVQDKIATIADAARKRLMLEIKYDGAVRLVEPYSMRQGRNGPLFYGFCSIHDRIHSFKPENIESITVSEFPFSPRWEVEF
jgi:predicted DNA-binding transcriptional regulator YafY